MNEAKEGYLLDTNIASLAFDAGRNRHTEIRERLGKLGEAAIFICPVSVGEVEYGLKVAYPGDKTRQEAVREALGHYETLLMDRHTAESYSTIRAELFNKYGVKRASGKFKTKFVEELVDPTNGREMGIQENDLWITSVALQYNLVFITNDHAEGMKRIIEAAGYQSRTEYW
ncbi:type II toxin-antitoxin system VapC family toxin [Chloroflexota bacterium]